MATQVPEPDTLLSHSQHRAAPAAGDGMNGATRSPPTSGSSRQTRRLQLRNAGFRGAAVPSRKITPNSLSSGNWSAASGMNGMSDAENVSPSGTKGNTPTTETRRSSGVLQEIGNSTVTYRPSKARRRVTSRMFEADAPGEDGMYATVPTSPPNRRASGRRQSGKSKPTVSHRRRSGNNEATKYIEHLEAELAAAQSQLSSVTSPSVTREHTFKVRTLNAETKKLQEELADWEAKYEVRVQEEVDRHYTIETDLKARIRHLELDADQAKLHIQELEIQVESTTQSMQAVETANVSLEKRLEMMGELLASSKVDLHAETPGRAKKHSRPKSLLPRFPTASSLMGSPERQTRTQPASPLFSFTHNLMEVPDSPTRTLPPFSPTPSQTDFASEADESVFSEDSATGDSMTSMEPCDGQHSNWNPWNLPPRPTNTAKPARRMRRFGAGSLVPKPLILPSATQYEYFPPASAPPLEHSRTTPAFFPRLMGSDMDSPSTGRRRASTMADSGSRPQSRASPFMDISEQILVDERLATLLSAASPAPSPPPSAESCTTRRRHSSIGSGLRRNLMEELSAARSVGTMGNTDLSNEDSREEEDAGGSQIIETDSSIEATDVALASPSTTTGIPHDLILLPQVSTTTPNRPLTYDRRARSGGRIIVPHTHPTSMLSRLRLLFGDLWRSPIVMARYLIQTAQARMRIPRPMVNVQWWLVGMLLGPMARNRMRSQRSCCREGEQVMLLEGAQEGDDGEGRGASGYGSLHESPASASSASVEEGEAGSDGSARSGSGTATGTGGKKRARFKGRCAHHQRHRRAKHSPWLWIKFSITLAFAIGVAFKDGPGSLLRSHACRCCARRRDDGAKGIEESDGEQSATAVAA